jgi:hypothetical protein
MRKNVRLLTDEASVRVELSGWGKLRGWGALPDFDA